MPLILDNYQCSLSERYLEQAKRELNEDPETRLEYCQKLLDAMSISNPEIIVNPDPRFLLRFLRTKKFNLDRAQEMLVQYYTMRYEEKGFQNLTPSSIRPLIEEKIGGILPKRDKQGRIVNVFFPGKWNIEKYEAIDLLKLNFLLLESAVMDENTQVSGIASIGNFEDYTLGHFLKFVTIAKKVGHLFDGAFPVRMKLSTMVNPPSIIGKIMSILTTVMSKKLMSRFNIITSTDFKDELIEVFGEDCLPADFGGNDSNDYMEVSNKRLYDLEEYMQEQLKYGISTTGTCTLVDNM